MKRNYQILSALACAAAFCTAGQASAQVVSTFDTDLEGWTAVGFNVDDSPLAILAGNVLSEVDNAPDVIHDTGGDLDAAFDGNLGGFARFTDVKVDPGSFLKAPASYTGDLTGFLGGTFSYDHRLFNEGSAATSVGPYVIVFVSGDPNDLNAYGAVLPGPGLGAADTGWVNVSTTIDAAGLAPMSDLNLGIFDPSFEGDTISGLSGGLLTTSQTLDQVMANVTDVYISFELVDNNSAQVSEAGGVDNVRMLEVPEPTSLALLGLGGLLVARRRR